MGDAWAVVFGAGIGATASIISTVGVEFWKDRRDRRNRLTDFQRESVMALQDAVEVMVHAAYDDITAMNFDPPERASRYFKTVPRASKLAARANDKELTDQLSALHRICLDATSGLEGDSIPPFSYKISLAHQEFDKIASKRLWP